MVDYKRLDDEVLKSQNVDRVTSVEKFEERSWDRDNVVQRVDEVRSNHDTIETILQDINEQLESIPDEDELRDEWESFLERMPTDNRGDEKQLPRAFYEAERDRSRLLLRQAIWQARLKELESFARRKLTDKFEMLLEEYRTAQSYEKLESMMEDKAEHFASKEVEEQSVEIRQWKNMIEKMGQSLREEKRSLWNMMERVAEEDTNSLSKSDVKDASKESLEEFVTSNNVFTVERDELDLDEKEVERESAAESAAEDVVENSEVVDGEDDLQVTDGDGTYLLKDRSFKEKVDVLVELWDEERIHERIDDPEDEITKSEVADMTDVTQATLFNQGLFEKIEEEEELFLRKP